VKETYGVPPGSSRFLAYVKVQHIAKYYLREETVFVLMIIVSFDYGR
jgi:hypothetical protein